MADVYNSYSSHESWTTPDPFASQYEDIIASVLAVPASDRPIRQPNIDALAKPAPGRAKSIFQLVLESRHIIYYIDEPATYKNGKLVKPSDSMQLTQAKALAENPSFSTAETMGKISTATGYVSSGLGVAAGVAAGIGVGSGAGGAAAATGVVTGANLGVTGAVGAAISAVSIAAVGIGLIVLPLAVISAHHAKAVAAEHVNDSLGADYANQWFDAAVPLMDAGKMDANYFAQYATSMTKDFNQLTSGSYKPGNAAWTLRWELAILLELYRRQAAAGYAAAQAKNSIAGVLGSPNLSLEALLGVGVVAAGLKLASVV